MVFVVLDGIDLAFFTHDLRELEGKVAGAAADVADLHAGLQIKRGDHLAGLLPCLARGIGKEDEVFEVAVAALDLGEVEEVLGVHLLVAEVVFVPEIAAQRGPFVFREHQIEALDLRVLQVLFLPRGLRLQQKLADPFQRRVFAAEVFVRDDVVVNLDGTARRSLVARLDEAQHLLGRARAPGGDVEGVEAAQMDERGLGCDLDDGRIALAGGGSRLGKGWPGAGQGAGEDDEDGGRRTGRGDVHEEGSWRGGKGGAAASVPGRGPQTVTTPGRVSSGAGRTTKKGGCTSRQTRPPARSVRGSWSPAPPPLRKTAPGSGTGSAGRPRIPRADTARSPAHGSSGRSRRRRTRRAG